MIKNYQIYTLWLQSMYDCKKSVIIFIWGWYIISFFITLILILSTVFFSKKYNIKVAEFIHGKFLRTGCVEIITLSQVKVIQR